MVRTLKNYISMARSSNYLVHDYSLERNVPTVAPLAAKKFGQISETRVFAARGAKIGENRSKMLSCTRGRRKSFVNLFFNEVNLEFSGY